MAFNLEVTFSGICAYVPNADDGSKDRICLVMPGGEGFFALDNECLCPHVSYVESSAGSATSFSRSSLGGYRVRFEIYPKENNNGVVVMPEDIALNKPAELAKMESAIAKPETDPDIVDVDPPRVVLTQIMLGMGKLSLANYDHKWRIRSLEGEYYESYLAHDVILSLKGLDAASLEFEALGGRKGRLPLRLTPSDAGGQVRIKMANSCTYAELNKEPPRDRDFKWYYNLLAAGQRKAIRKLLNDRIREDTGNDQYSPYDDLPFWRRHKVLDNGANCYCVRFPYVPF